MCTNIRLRHTRFNYLVTQANNHTLLLSQSLQVHKCTDWIAVSDLIFTFEAHFPVQGVQYMQKSVSIFKPCCDLCSWRLEIKMINWSPIVIFSHLFSIFFEFKIPSKAKKKKKLIIIHQLNSSISKCFVESPTAIMLSRAFIFMYNFGFWRLLN